MGKKNSLANGDISPESSPQPLILLYSRLAAMIAYKRKQSLSLISSWIKREPAFALIYSISMCLRGSRFVVSSLPVSISDDAKSSETRSKIGDD